MTLRPLSDHAASILSGGAPLTGPRRSTPPSPEKARQYAERCPPRVDYHAEAMAIRWCVGFLIVSALLGVAALFS